MEVTVEKPLSVSLLQTLWVFMLSYSCAFGRSLGKAIGLSAIRSSFTQMTATEFAEFGKAASQGVWYGTVGANDCLVLPAGWLWAERVLQADLVGFRLRFLYHDDLPMFEQLQEIGLATSEPNAPVSAVCDFLTLYEPVKGDILGGTEDTGT